MKSLFMRSGFTLLELLIVIAVIMILLSVLLPGLQSALEKGRQVLCAANLKTLGTWHAQYESDFRAYPYVFRSQQWKNNTTEPYIREFGENRTYDPTCQHWGKTFWTCGYIRPGAKPTTNTMSTAYSKAFQCPSISNVKPGSVYPTYGRTYWSSYTIQGDTDDQWILLARYITPKQIKNPSGKIMIQDSKETTDFYVGGLKDETAYYHGKSAFESPGSAVLTTPFLSNPSKSNVLFWDGHTGSYSIGALYQLNNGFFQGTIYRNDK